MNSIVLNYKINKSLNKNKLEKIINGCLSTKYKIFLNIYDFSLLKDTNETIKDFNTSNIDISILNHDYENFSNADNIILNNLIKNGDSIAFGIFTDNLFFNSGSLDEINIDLLKNDVNGLIYFDYTINDIRCFLKTRSMDIKINAPAIFWSTNKLIKYLLEKDKLNIILNNFAAIHIPNSFCKIFTDDK